MNVIAKNTKTVRTVCRSCWAGCGIMVEAAEDGQVVVLAPWLVRSQRHQAHELRGH